MKDLFEKYYCDLNINEKVNFKSYFHKLNFIDDKMVICKRYMIKPIYKVFYYRFKTHSKKN